MKINEVINKLISSAILQSLKGSKEKTFSELTEDVKKIIQKKFGILKIPSPGTLFLCGSTWNQGVLSKLLQGAAEN